MPKIHKLDQNLINKIAAGEVVERPASVVKELMENSLDSGATKIVVEINNSGFDLIKITDNGCGISKEDLPMAIEEHATSKINSVEDLFSIKTFGFRGEALSSISAVSKFSLASKTKDSLSGAKVYFDNDKLVVSDIGRPDGTEVFVEQLFYNMPARKNFLKAKSTEFNHIVEAFIKNAIIYPQISFQLIHNNKSIYNLLGTDKWISRIKDLFGQNTADNIKEVNYNSVDFSLSGFLGNHFISRNNSKRQFLFLNKRPVFDYLINKAVKDAYKGIILHNEYPFFILNINLPDGTVDVNVHPRKMEVKFADSSKVYGSVYRIVGDLLDKDNLVEALGVMNQVSKGGFGVSGETRLESTKSQIPMANQTPNHNVQIPKFEFHGENKNLRFKEFGREKFDDSFILEKKENNNFQGNFGVKILGQYQNAYIIFEKDFKLYILDQHAGSERMQYEKIKKQWQEQKITVQQLLMPMSLDLSFSEKQIFLENKSYLEKLGFAIDEFGENSLNVNSVPQAVAGKDLKKIILEMLDELAEKKEAKDYEEKIDDMIKSMACKSAVKFGDALNFEEIKSLVNNLFLTDNKEHCPHGRPAFLEFSMDNLKKMFKR